MLAQGSARLNRRGFTLVEIMIVVVIVIVGVLASLAIPVFMKVRYQSMGSRIANDFRQYRSAFVVYYMEEGSLPPDANPGVLPSGMEGSLVNFTVEAPNGDLWDWEYQSVGVTAGLSLVGMNTPEIVMERVDELLDDGDLGAGQFSLNGARYTWRLE